MKKVEVTSCSQSQGCPISRVITSKNTDVVKPRRHMPQSAIMMRSTKSSARHLRWRWDCRTMSPVAFIVPRSRYGTGLLHGADELQELDRMWAEVAGDLVLDRLGDLDEAGLVDILHELDTHLLELRHRVVLEAERVGGLELVDLVGGGLHPLLLLIAEAGPGLVADPDAVHVRLVLRHRHDRRHFVVLVRHVDVDAVLGHVDHARLQRGIDVARSE